MFYLHIEQSATIVCINPTFTTVSWVSFPVRIQYLLFMQPKFPVDMHEYNRNENDFVLLAIIVVGLCTKRTDLYFYLLKRESEKKGSCI